ncbi:MAG TPA: UTP--glucose-1-phosphate uridylyltransferase GalU [Thermoplasmata archaeon]|jgi:UTP--glucose-1-phosphate uridylyltransferase
MKAVIPAAGLGTRFLPLTKEQPKEMLPVVDRPAIHWVVEEAIASGATDILIVTGREKRAIEDYFDASLRWDHYLKGSNNHALKDLYELISQADFHFIRQREPKGLGDAILQAEKHVGQEPFLVILGDTINVGDPPVGRQLWDAWEDVGYNVIAVERVRKSKISDYGIVDPGKAVNERISEVKDLVEKPRPEDAPSDLGITGSYVLTPTIFRAIRDTKPGRNGEVQLTDAMRVLLKSEPIYAYRFLGRRYDIGTKFDWFRAHVELTLQNKEFQAAGIEFLKELLKDA